MKSLKYIFALLVLAPLMSCEKTLFEEEPGTDPESLFEEFWGTYQRDYACFDEREVDWQAQYDQYRPLVNANTTDDQLADYFKQMLRSLDDGHVSLILPGQRIFISNLIIDQEIDNDLFDLDLVKSSYLQDEYLVNGEGGNTYGWIGSFGYLYLDYIGDNLFGIDEILDHFAACEGLIIDLRHNQGGDFTYAYSELGRLTDTDRFVSRSQTKNGPGENDFTEWFDWYLRPAGTYFDKPIIVLTDRYTISAGERLLMILKALPNVLHLGDTSSGAFATKINKELPNGWYYSLVTQNVEFLDGQSYEGRGMEPDVFVKNTATEMANGIDRTLEEALDRF